MTEAKYHIGQLVAVCTGSLSQVIPETTVTDRKRVENHGLRHPISKDVKVVSGWLYRVAGNPVWWFQEQWLRPIDKDEYTDSDLSTQPQDKEQA